jgi:hypothetical protein
MLSAQKTVWQFPEKVIFLRLLKNAQMQGARKPFTCRSGRQS